MDNYKLACVAASILCVCASPSIIASTTAPDAEAAHWQSRFEANVGQAHKKVDFTLRAANYSAALSAAQVWLKLDVAPVRSTHEPDETGKTPVTPDSALLGLHFVESNSGAELIGAGESTGNSNYILGQATEPMRANRYERVRASNIYPGVDVVYQLQDGHLRFDFEIEAHADARAIALQFTGADELAVDTNGDLIISLQGRTLHQRAPLIFQMLDGKRTPVAGGYQISDNGQVQFALADYDTSRHLTIDPTLEYATLLGGSGSEFGEDIAIAANGDRIICGTTTSMDFPVINPVQAGNQSVPGLRDIVVARLAADGSGTVFATYLGGSQDDFCNRIAIDSNENIVVAGYTLSDDYPTFNAFDPTFAGSEDPNLDPGQDGFVTKLAADGSALIFSTYVGGADLVVDFFGRETIRGLYIDDSDRVLLVGNTGAPDFPVTHLLNGRPCMTESPDIGSSFVSDIIVTRLNPDGALDTSTCLGGDQRDAGRGVVVNDSGQIVVIGHTRSFDYPVTPGAVVDHPPSDGFNYDIITTVLNADATAVVHSARLGGTYFEFLQDVTLDASGNIVVGGSSASDDFPVTANAYQTALGNIPGDFSDMLLMKYSPTLDNLLFATYLGGAGDEFTFNVGVDEYGQIVTVTSSGSADLPLRKPLQPAKAPDFAGPQVPAPSELGANAIAEGTLFGASDPAVTHFMVVARNGANLLYLKQASGEVSLSGALGTEMLDTRAVLAADINFDGLEDVVTGNYLGQNYYYLRDSTGDFLPGVAFGGAMSATVALAYSNGVLYEGNLSQANAWYETGSTLFVNNGTFGTALVETRDLDAANGYLVEVRGPANLAFWQLTGGEPTLVQLAPMGAGFDIRLLVPANGLYGDGTTQLLIANAAGPASIANFSSPGGAFSIDIRELDANITDIKAITFMPNFFDVLGIIVTATDTGLRFYDWADSDDELRQVIPTATPVTVLGTTGEFNSSSLIAAAGPGLATQFYSRGTSDAYIAVLDSQGEKLLFGSYLGGAGEEDVDWGLSLHSGGSLTFVGTTGATDFPVTTAATRNGIRDFLVARVHYAGDPDGDGISDLADNCTLVANAGQRDTNGDGYGNACDPDLDGNGAVNFVDLGMLKQSFFTMPGDADWDPDADFNGDFAVNFQDLGIMKSFFFGAPGPSGQVD